MSLKTMETEVLRTICASQGAVNTVDLMSNLGFGDTTTQIIANREKFAVCCPFGQPKVVAWTNMKLCRDKTCAGSCKGLHLCKNFLFSGSCHFIQSRRGCTFSHELNSLHNQMILTEFELESLSMTELCTLLLQSDHMLLPQICFDYNNGKCEDSSGCKRVHVCQRYLNLDCTCFKNHDFSAPQPLKVLHDRFVPDSLIRCLKSVYANKEALRYAQKQSGEGNQGNRESSAATSSYGCGNDVLNLQKKEWGRGRGRGGFRGNRGYMGNRGHRGNRGNRGNLDSRPSSRSDTLPDVDGLDLYNSGGESEGALEPGRANDFDTKSNDDQMKKRRGNQRGRGGNRGHRGNRGNRENRGNQDSRPASRSDTLSDTDGLDLYESDGESEGNVEPGRASDFDAIGGQVKNQRGNPSGRGGNRGNRGKQPEFTSDPAFSKNGPNSRPIRDKTEICLYFIRGHCIHDDEKCFKAHDKMPYRWEVNKENKWTALADNEKIEKDFCDPKNSYSSSSSPPVHFDTMTQEQNKVRRLSTANSLLQPDFMYTTDWLWYWEDEFGKWTMYASATGGHKPADMDSTKLEQKFLENDKDVLEFIAGSQSYSLSFQDMMQTNKHYGTMRLVKRRPRFVSASDVLAKRVRRPPGKSNQASFTGIPDHWDKSQISQTGYKRVNLHCTSDEFKEIEALFCQTLRGFDIVKIERIQNKPLWELFQWQKNQMKNNNKGADVTEKKLFHGTDSKYVDIICQTNFDWRVCGTHGTAYGQGSYFARDAKYSHSYTGNSDVRSMFVSRVLVGNYTRGSSDYRRPPSKDGGDINFFDSCVDDILTPSIFVVFDKLQIYPEYLLQYKTMHPLVSMYRGAPTPAVKPVIAPVAAAPVAPKPTVSVYSSSASSYQPSPSLSQSSTSSYQSSTSLNQSSASSYKPSSSLSHASTSSSQPSAPSYKPSSSLSHASTSSSRPSASSYQPSSSLSQSSTSSYTSTYKTRNTPYPLIDFAPAAPPSPPPRNTKKSDSCVIA